MLRGFASRCLEPVDRRSSSYRAIWRRSFVARRRRSGDGRRWEWFEERSAASQEEYFRRETARQLKEIRERQLREVHERGIKRKAEEEQEIDRKEKTRKPSNPTETGNL